MEAAGRCHVQRTSASAFGVTDRRPERRPCVDSRQGTRRRQLPLSRVSRSEPTIPLPANSGHGQTAPRTSPVSERQFHALNVRKPAVLDSGPHVDIPRALMAPPIFSASSRAAARRCREPQSWMRSFAQSPDAATRSPAATAAARPASVARSRWLQTFTRRTQKPLSGFWNVIRSTMPARTSCSGRTDGEQSGDHAPDYRLVRLAIGSKPGPQSAAVGR